MKKPEKSEEELLVELEELRGQLAEAEATLRTLQTDELERIFASARTEHPCPLKTIFKNAAIGMALVNLDGRLLAGNPALLDIFGCSERDLPGILCTLFAHPDDTATHSSYFLELTAGKRDRYQMEKRYMLKDGHLLWCQMSVSLIRDAEGSPHFAVVLLLNTTERKQTERALRQSEARYRAIVEDQVELVSRILPDYTFSFVNEAYCRRFGEAREELIGSSLFDRVPAKGRERLKKHFDSLSPENPVATIQHRLMMPNGVVCWQQWTDRAIFDDHGRLKEIQSVGRDITRQKQAEEGLQESEQQLRYLSSQLLTVQETERKRISQELHDSVGQYLSAIKYGLENILQLSGSGKVKAVTESLDALILLVRTSIEEVRRIYMDLRPSLLDDLGILPTIDWFCREFERIYTGISVEREITIREEDVPEPLKIIIFRIIQEALNNISKHSSADVAHVSLSKTGERIELVIRDNGRGFNVKGPYSKETLGGGLGLASMRERAELSGGSFAIESADGLGSIIRVSLPCDIHLKA